MLSFSAGGTSAQDDSILYRAVAFVTGTEEPERSRGFRDGLKQAVVKLTGNASLATSPRLTPYLDGAAGLVASFEYEDRMKGIPVHDEQGTRERPHFLRITFDKGKLDNILTELTLKKWPLPRPRLSVLIAVITPKRRFVVTETSGPAYGQREVLRSVSERRAIPIALPENEKWISVKMIKAGTVDEMDKAPAAVGGNCPLSGTLKLDDKGIYWDMRWTLHCHGTSARWSLSGVTYDNALASGLEHSARILSQRDAKQH
ncbi:MAG: DUF2066 domain-containing protein [Hyphomicrobiaceae bacterium]|nr:DUF2066 domain-containing protein [Hyphomicrobiaceae bacterium]